MHRYATTNNPGGLNDVGARDVAKPMKTFIPITLTAVALIGCSHPQTQSNAAAKAYTLNKCLVTDEALDHDTYTFVYNGQEIKLCCKSCLKDFEKTPSKYLSKLK